MNTELKYVKTFESFSSADTENVESIFEAAVSPAIKKMDKKTVEEVKAKIEGMDQEKLKAELLAFGKKIGLAAEDLTDPQKVADAMIKKGMLKESNSIEFDTEINEGKISDWYKNSKKWVMEMIAKAGAFSMLGGLITMGIGAEMMPNVEHLMHNATVTPNSWVIAGGVAMIIGLTATIVGLKGSGNLGAMGSAAASSKR